MTRKADSRAVLLLAAASLAFAAAATGQVCNATNDPSVAIARTADLQFGELGSTPSAGTAVIAAATGSRTVTGGVIGTGALYNAGAFAVLLCGPAGPKRFDLVLPAGAITLSGPAGATMTVDTFTSDSGPSNIVGDTSSPTTVNVGGTLHVGANQPPGDYTGTFTVIVARQ